MTAPIYTEYLLHRIGDPAMPVSRATATGVMRVLVKDLELDYDIPVEYRLVTQHDGVVVSDLTYPISDMLVVLTGVALREHAASRQARSVRG